MNDSPACADPAWPPVQDLAPGLTIAALRARGADQFDPIRFCFIEALARRAATQADEVKCILNPRVARLLTEYAERHESSRSEAGNGVDHRAQKVSLAAVGLSRRAAPLGGLPQPGPLADLVQQIDRQASRHGPTRSAEPLTAQLGAPTELKALRYFRSTWSQLSVDRQLRQSLAKVPENAGPLNSQRLVLRSLQMMRELAPDYLQRFMSYVDALQWLDQANCNAAAPQAKAQRGERDHRRNSGRGKSA